MAARPDVSLLAAQARRALPVSFPVTGFAPDGVEGGDSRRDPPRRHWQGRVARVAHQPLEFDADPLRRPGLQTDPVHVPGGVLLIEVAAIMRHR